MVHVYFIRSKQGCPSGGQPDGGLKHNCALALNRLLAPPDYCRPQFGTILTRPPDLIHKEGMEEGRCLECGVIAANENLVGCCERECRNIFLELCDFDRWFHELVQCGQCGVISC